MKEVFENFENNKHYGSLYVVNRACAAILQDVIKELEVTKGAIILDGYQVEDTCVKFLDKSINIFREKHDELESSFKE